MMGRIIVVIKAILTRVMFATHGLVAIWRATTIKHDPYYWYLTASILALSFEGVFTLTIKKNQEWKWFCPSVFFYLASVVPAIWIIEVDKFDRRLATMEGLNITSDGGVMASLGVFDGIVQIPQFDPETWATVIEQLLMLILIIGRWMLPKGGLTRDQLSQLLLVYIGTAADIIEFFDTFKEPKIAAERVLCLAILAIWSWSLLQFTFVLTATKARRTRLTGVESAPVPAAAPSTKRRGKFDKIVKVKQVCCTIDVWAILINIILQDAPFLIFRLLLITYFRIITYMNVFFTCKNTLVIVLQFYRLFVVQVERKKETETKAQAAAKKGGLPAPPGAAGESSGLALAMAIERAAFIGPSGAQRQQQKRAGGGKGHGQGSEDGRGAAARVSGGKGKDDSPKNQFRGRRKSLSTGNLVSHSEREGDRRHGRDSPDGDEDCLEQLRASASGSILSRYSDEEQSDSTLELGSGSVVVRFENEIRERERSARARAERDRKAHTRTRLAQTHTHGAGGGSHSHSRSSETGSGSRLVNGQGRRQDTGYSSSSKESSDRLAVRSGHGRGRRHRRDRGQKIHDRDAEDELERVENERI